MSPDIIFAACLMPLRCFRHTPFRLLLSFDICFSAFDYAATLRCYAVDYFDASLTLPYAALRYSEDAAAAIFAATPICQIDIFHFRLLFSPFRRRHISATPLLPPHAGADICYA